MDFIDQRFGREFLRQDLPQLNTKNRWRWGIRLLALACVCCRRRHNGCRRKISATRWWPPVPVVDGAALLLENPAALS
ncbi:MAG: hypothetical protein R3F38_19800 [Gammaproteobacteria bacterium]